MTGAPEPARSPTGRQYEIHHGDQRATVVQVGGGLRRYEVGGFPVLDGYGPEELASAGRGQVLAPWPNRLAGGRYEFAGRALQLPLSEPSRQNAIHGLVRWSGWEELEASPARARLGHVLWPQAGYPFMLGLEIEYELSGEGLRVTMAAENLGAQPAPYGVGQHPYVRVGLGKIDGAVLRCRAATWLETDSRQIPTGRMLGVEGSAYDFREARPVGSTRLDTAFTDLARDGRGRASLELRAPDGDRHVRVWVDARFEYLMLFTGDTLGEPARRRSLAVEPMTCAPDAFRNGLGLRSLEPGERTAASWGISAGRQTVVPGT